MSSNAVSTAATTHADSVCLRVPWVAAGDARDGVKVSTVAEFRDMKMQPSLKRALRHQEMLGGVGWCGGVKMPAGFWNWPHRSLLMD